MRRSFRGPPAGSECKLYLWPVPYAVPRWQDQACQAGCECLGGIKDSNDPCENRAALRRKAGASDIRENACQPGAAVAGRRLSDCFAACCRPERDFSGFVQYSGCGNPAGINRRFTVLLVPTGLLVVDHPVSFSYPPDCWAGAAVAAGLVSGRLPDLPCLVLEYIQDAGAVLSVAFAGVAGCRNRVAGTRGAALHRYRLRFRRTGSASGATT